MIPGRVGLLTHDSGATHPLRVETLCGRDARCDAREIALRVSMHHARLRWHGGQWEVKDLASENGTWVNGARLGPGWRPLLRGDRIGLGSPDGGWTLTDDHAPQPFAVAADPSVWVGMDEDDVLRLPDARIWETVDRGWVVAGPEGERPLRSARLIGEWRLVLPEDAHPTEQALRRLAIADVSLAFRVSRSQDHVALDLIVGDERISLGRREPFWLLLLLARARAEDTEGPEHDRGWVDIDELARMTRWARPRVDIYTLRARRALREAGLTGPGDIVEARPNERRLGIPPERVDLGDVDER